MMNSELTLLSNTQFYKYVLQYIYTHYNGQIKSFEYITESNVRPYEYVRRNERGTIKVCSPNDTNFDLDYKDEIINFDLKTLRNEATKTLQKIFDMDQGVNRHVKKRLEKNNTPGKDNDLLIDFVDKAKKHCEEQIKLSQKSNNKSIKIHMWRKDYWEFVIKKSKKTN